MMLSPVHGLIVLLALIVPLALTVFYVAVAVIVIGILRDIRDELRRGRQSS